MTLAHQMLSLLRSLPLVQGNQILMRNRLSIAMSTATISTRKLPFNPMAHRLRKTGDRPSRRLLKRWRLTILRSLMKKVSTTQAKQEVLGCRCQTNVLNAVRIQYTLDTLHAHQRCLTDWEHGPPPKIIVSDFNFFSKLGKIGLKKMLGGVSFPHWTFFSPGASFSQWTFQ